MKNKRNKGITLIEIIVVIGILTVIVAFGMIVDFSSFTSDTLQAEESKIVSILEKARSRAMSNMFGTKHGVCYEEAKDSYVIFQGSICDASAPTSELISANTNIAENPGTDFPTFIFDQLAGTTSGDTIHITDGIKSEDIEINDEGTINW